MERRRAYLVLMGACLVLFVLAWAVVRHVSVPAAVVLGLVAAAVPLVAVAVANSSTDGDDETLGDDLIWDPDVEDDQTP